MSENQRHLYEILHPNSALVASQLSPEQFASHYRVGSTRFYSGRLNFAEIDTDFRHDYFDIETGLSALKAHPDGRPKSTKFISCYRVLEHMDFGALKRLYLSSPDGYVLGLDKAPYDKSHQDGFIRTFAEITPVEMLALSTHDLPTFGRYITDPKNPKGAPKIFFTQFELDIDEFLEEFARNPFMPAPLPPLHPAKLRDAVLNFRKDDSKGVKGLSLSCDLEHISLRRVRHGFMFASRDEQAFFPIPPLEEIERNNPKFFRSM